MPDKKADDKNKEQAKENSIEEKQNVAQAHEQAENDIQSDPDLTSKSDPADDLDEGELASLEGEK